jgi:hypothetical protein
LLLSVRRLRRRIEAPSGRPAVVVLGMHRSGTSSVAGALVRLGGAAPLHLMPPHRDNERGYWESDIVANLNDAILAAGGSDWRDWRAFDPRRMRRRTALALRLRAGTALNDEFDGASLPILKDPRMCRLMRVWSPVFGDVGWSVRVVLPVRSPLEVAWSLNGRDGASLSYACLLWIRYVLEAEAGTRGMPRAVLSWRDFLNDRRRTLKQVCTHLDLALPNWSREGLAAVDEFVSESLRRHRASDGELRTHPAMNEFARETYAAMLELVRDPNDERVLRRLDHVRLNLECAARFLDPAMRDLEAEVRRLQSQAAA